MVGRAAVGEVIGLLFRLEKACRVDCYEWGRVAARWLRYPNAVVSGLSRPFEPAESIRTSP